MSGQKRKLNTMLLSDKVRLIIEVDKGVKKKKVIAEDFGIPPSTLSSIIRNREEILNKVENSATNDRKRMTKCKYADIDKATLEWFKIARDNNMPMSGPLIRKKALYFAKSLGHTDFVASVGWLEMFKKRHNIIQKVMYGESADVNEPDCEASYEKDIFNADETGLFLKRLPKKMLIFKDEKCFSGKHNKERITAVVGANMCDTEKLKPLVIGKSKNPRCFKDVEQAWTPEDIDSLISLVKTYNAIFDQSHPDYNTKENLDNIWQQIGIKLKRAPESCSKRWQLLFSIYKKKKITQKLNSDKIPKWPYFDSLDFLKDYLKDIPNAKFSATNTHSQSSGTSQDNSEQASLTEAVFLTENNYNNVLVSEEFGDIKTEIKLEDNFEEIQNDSENEFSNDMESNSRLENYYTNNSYSVDEQGNEMESCSELEGFGNHLTPHTSKSGKSNSMELFLLSLVEDANNLSKTGQREFKTKTLALLHTLE